MTSLQDSFSSISQLADSVAMPSEAEMIEKEDEGRIALEEGLERVRLMILADVGVEEIRRVWESLDLKDIVDGTLKHKVDEVRRMVDSLPPTIHINEEETPIET